MKKGAQPEIKLNVQHYHLQQGTCQSCGRSQKAQLPNEIQAGYGPRFTALTAELSGPMRNSRTEVKRFYQSVFDIKISRGGVQQCVDRASKALRPIWDHFGQLSQKTAVNHIDKTAWKQRGFAHRLENDRLNLTLFLSHDDLEPPNNNAERAIRFLVLWRKIQMGTDSHKGNRWVERVASMVGTCRKLKLSTFGVLSNAISSLFHQQDPDLTPFDQPRLVS